MKATQESISGAYVRGELSRPEYLTSISALHSTLGHCTCNACAEVRSATPDPRFPDYSKVTGNGFAADREVQDSQRGGVK